MIKTNKTGVYYNLLENGEKVFYFTYNDINDNKKKKWVKVGKYSDGIREINAFNLRAEQLSMMKHGTDITAIANKKKVNITTYDDLAQIYFTDKKVDKYRINKYELHIKPSIGNKDIHSITNSKFGYSVTVEINQLDFYNAREQSILKAIEICQKK